MARLHQRDLPMTRPPLHAVFDALAPEKFDSTHELYAWLR